MTKMVIFFTTAIGVLFALDWYVYRHWRFFVKHRPRKKTSLLNLSLPIYLFFMGVMPATLPLYFTFSRWWEVEPKLARALFVGFWGFYYLPKMIIAAALGLKDFGRFTIWLFQWFQKTLRRKAITEKAQVTSAPTAETLSPPLDLIDMKQLSRRAFIERMGWTASAIPFVVTGYSVFRTLYDFKVHTVDIPLPHLPPALDGLTVLQLSDLHAGSFFSERPMLDAADIIKSLKPDLITITGDYVNNNDAELERILPALNALEAPLGVYGCLGNHDHYANTQAVADRLKHTPVRLLVNEHETITIDGANLHVLGTDNTGFNQNYADLNKAKSGIQTQGKGDEIKVLLAHDPTFWDAHVRPAHPDIDLMLCGHTHGGQVGVEMGPVRFSLARIAYPRWAGLYQENRAQNPSVDQFLYVNRGLGTVGPPIRFGVRPEITLLTLRKA